MKRLAELLAIRSGEGRLASLVIGVMLITAAGSTFGSTGVETLFFTRFGVQYLPYMFMVLGVITMATSLAVTALIGRMSRERLYIALPFVLAIILLVSRAALLSGFGWLYPVLWLGKEVINTLIGFLVWGVAGVVCDTRQSKRLFPLFNAGRILGAVLGGLFTGLLVSWFGTENLLLVWGVTLVLVFFFCQALLRGRVAPASRPRRSSHKQAGFIQEIQQGYQYVQQSKLMVWISLASVLFSVLYFSIALPFSRVATEQFPNEAQLAGFLGTFQGLSTAAAFLASLFLANRLFARFGIMTMMLAFTAVYLFGFGAMVIAPIFVVIVSFRFLQMLWLSGIADPAFQAIFNVVPSERRDQVRTFIGGVPSQAGTFIGGLVLLIGEQTLSPSQLSLIGFISAAICVYSIWESRRAYNTALVDALRAGRPQVFFSEEEPFGGFQRDAAAMSALIAGTRSEDVLIRRVSTEILGELDAPEAKEALINALYDSDAMVRVHAIRALAHTQIESAWDEIKARLTDADLEVRVEAVENLPRFGVPTSDVVAALEPLLSDPTPRVCVRAAASILKLGSQSKARELLRDLAVHGDEESRVQALSAIGASQDAESFDLLADQLKDTSVAVRRAALSALRGTEAERGLPILIEALGDAELRQTAAKAIGEIGAPAASAVFDALSNPRLESGALLALEFLQSPNPKWIEAFARSAVLRAVHYDELVRSISGENGRAKLLEKLLREKMQQQGLSALQAIALIGDKETLKVAIENLESSSPDQRANVLEALESISERFREIIRPLMRLWDESQPAAIALSPSAALLAALTDSDEWVRTCAAFAASPHAELKPALEQLIASDPDPFAREVAAISMNGDHSMDTLPTLPLMERILFFRRVPLFANLSTADLKQVAAISEESTFVDKDEIALQGETGDTMYIIVSGEIQVTAVKGDGASTELARRKAGEVVGEMAIISKEPRMASLIALGDVRTLCIDQKSFEGLLRERAEVSLAVMQVLCTRIKEMAK